MGSTVGRPPTGGATAAAAAGGGKKRAAWDLKGRLLDMESTMALHMKQNTNLQDQMTANQERIVLLESINIQLEGTVAQKEEQTKVTSQEAEVVKKQLR